MGHFFVTCSKDNMFVESCKHCGEVLITALAKSTHPCLSQEVEDAGKLPKSPTEMPSKFRGTKRMSSEKNPRPKIQDEDRMKIRKKYVDKRKFNNRKCAFCQKYARVFGGDFRKHFKSCEVLPKYVDIKERKCLTCKETMVKYDAPIVHYRKNHSDVLGQIIGKEIIANMKTDKVATL